MRPALTLLLSLVTFLATPATGQGPVPATPASPAAPAAADTVRIGDQETIVFYGDSITEQNLYSAYLETFLHSRFPKKKLAIFNFGWGGDTAHGGNVRFARDVAPVQPSLVFVNFGMNDGGYTAYDEQTYRRYIDSQRALADTIKAAGTRQVLFTTSPVDDVLRGDGGVYNETLARMASGVIALGRERQIPVIDLLHPMLDVQRDAKQSSPAFTMIPDTIHPDAVGHLVMAYFAMRQIDAPRTIGELEVNGPTLKATGVTVQNVSAGDGVLDFDITLPFIPFYVPPEARKALDLVPLQDEVNRFRLRGTPGPGQKELLLSVNGRVSGVFTAGELAKGVDLALLDKAPWTEQGRTLWSAAQLRWQKHFEAWRRMGLDRPAAMMPALPSFDAHVRAQRAYADDLGRALGALAQPGTYHATLAVPGERVTISSLAISPAYPGGSFDMAHPPEKDAASVAWTTVPLQKGVVDLAAHFGGASQVASYARLVLEADRAATIHLSLGSDDGLAVFVDGRRVLARDVLRPLRLGDEEVTVKLAPGRHELLFKITQAGGGFGLAVEAQVLGNAKVRQVAP